MPHEFEVREEISLAATPEQVWEAIATGPGINSWFMGHSEVEPRLGGRNRMTLMGHTQESTVTEWEPGKRFAFRSDPDPDGTFMAFEYLIEGRDQGSTVLRFVHSGTLGDDWQDEYDALKVGDRMYLEKLATYLAHFPGRTARHSMFLVAGQDPDYDRVWAAFSGALGLSGPADPGDEVRLTVPGVPAAEGVVAFVRPKTFLGVRTGDGIYMLIHGYQDAVVVEHHGYTENPDAAAEEQAWQAYFAGKLAPAA